MTAGEFERQVHQECLRILRFLVSKRYDSASQKVAGLALLAEERCEYGTSCHMQAPEDPYDLRLLDAFGCDEDERDL